VQSSRGSLATRQRLARRDGALAGREICLPNAGRAVGTLAAFASALGDDCMLRSLALMVRKAARVAGLSCLKFI